jgi:hypothetical protein
MRARTFTYHVLFTDNAIKARACKCVWWAFFKASRLSEINPGDLTLILWRAGNNQFRISYSNTQAGIKIKLSHFLPKRKDFGATILEIYSLESIIFVSLSCISGCESGTVRGFKQHFIPR